MQKLGLTPNYQQYRALHGSSYKETELAFSRMRL